MSATHVYAVIRQRFGNEFEVAELKIEKLTEKKVFLAAPGHASGWNKTIDRDRAYFTRAAAIAACLAANERNLAAAERGLMEARERVASLRAMLRAEEVSP